MADEEDLPPGFSYEKPQQQSQQDSDLPEGFSYDQPSVWKDIGKAALSGAERMPGRAVGDVVWLGDLLNRGIDQLPYVGGTYKPMYKDAGELPEKYASETQKGISNIFNTSPDYYEAKTPLGKEYGPMVTAGVEHIPQMYFGAKGLGQASRFVPEPIRKVAERGMEGLGLSFGLDPEKWFERIHHALSSAGGNK